MTMLCNGCGLGVTVFFFRLVKPFRSAHGEEVGFVAATVLNLDRKENQKKALFQSRAAGATSICCRGRCGRSVVETFISHMHVWSSASSRRRLLVPRTVGLTGPDI